MVWFEKMFLCVWQLSMPMFIILTIMMGMRKDVISYNPESYFCTSDIIQLGNCSTKLSTNINLPKVRKIRLRTTMNGYSSMCTKYLFFAPSPNKQSAIQLIIMIKMLRLFDVTCCGATCYQVEGAQEL